MFEGPVQRVIDELSRLPGIGSKSAQRLAFHLLTIEAADARRLSAAINDMRDQVTTCTRCFNVAAGDLCAICRDTRRDDTLVCVVERPQDIVVVERTQEFRGRYHVLGGSLSPINGVGPGQLRFDELRRRLQPEGVTELIVATNPTVEGETTAYPDNAADPWYEMFVGHVEPIYCTDFETDPFGDITSFTKNAVSEIIGPQAASYQPTEPSSKVTCRWP